jgi:hypothetical protein
MNPQNLPLTSPHQDDSANVVSNRLMSSAVRSMPPRPASSVRLALPPAVERQNRPEEEGIPCAIDGASPPQRHSRRRLASAAAACETFQRGDGRHIYGVPAAIELNPVSWQPQCLQGDENSHERAVNPQPLTDAEFDKLADLLNRFGDKRAMNLEMLDGFFAALICGPDDVPPSEYLPEIWGGDMVNKPAFQTKPIFARVYFARDATLECDQ